MTAGYSAGNLSLPRDRMDPHNDFGHVDRCVSAPLPGASVAGGVPRAELPANPFTVCELHKQAFHEPKNLTATGLRIGDATNARRLVGIGP
jgi:hypothetical protein